MSFAKDLPTHHKYRNMALGECVMSSKQYTFNPKLAQYSLWHTISGLAWVITGILATVMILMAYM